MIPTSYSLDNSVLTHHQVKPEPFALGLDTQHFEARSIIGTGKAAAAVSPFGSPAPESAKNHASYGTTTRRALGSRRQGSHSNNHAKNAPRKAFSLRDIDLATSVLLVLFSPPVHFSTTFLESTVVNIIPPAF
jgi:hypothetical protein